MANGVVVGLERGTGKPVVLTSEARPLSLYVIGTPGSGKSTLLENIAWQDIQGGDGLLFIDPHGESADRLLAAVPPHRRDDVVFWHPYDYTHPFGFNPLVCNPDDPIAVSTRAQSFVAALESFSEFSEVFTTATRMKEVLLNLAYAFIYNQGHSLVEANRFLAVDDAGEIFRKTFYEKLAHYNVEVLRFWQEYDSLKTAYARREVTGAAANKLRRFTTDPIMQSIFGKTTNSLNFRKVIEEGRVLILKLSGIGEYNAAFIGAFVIWELWQAALLRGKSASVRPFHIIADEFENYMTLVFPQIQKQGRGFKLDAVIAHQERSGLSEEMAGSTLSVKNKVVFLASGKDAAELAREFKKERESRTHEQQKFVFASDLLDHLASRGHERERVVAFHRLLVAQMSHLFGYAQTQREREEMVHAAAKTQEVELPPLKAGYAQEVSAARVRFESEVSSLLYTLMTSPAKETLQELWEAQGGIQTRLTAVLDGLYTRLLSIVDQSIVARLREQEWPALREALRRGEGRVMEVPDERAFFWNRGGTLWGWEQGMRVLLYQLGEALQETPCFVRSGQLETVVASERSIKDIQDELADVVASQRFRTALVSVIEDLEPAQYVVEIDRLVGEPTNEGRTQAEEIVERCRRLYGKAVAETPKAEEAAKAIAEGPATYQTGTILESTPTEPEQPAGTTREEAEDEIILIDEVVKRAKKV